MPGRPLVSRLPGGLRPLARRDFALLWSCALVSNVGSWMQTVAVGVLVTTRTREAAWTGLVAAAGFLPLGLLAPVGGALADRLDRRRLLLATTAGEAAFAGGLAALAGLGRASPGAVTLCVLAGQSMAGLGLAPYTSMLPQLVGPGEALGAISLSSAQFNLGRVVGPALAGVVIVAAGYTWAFAINAVSFLAVVAALCLVRPRPLDQGGAPAGGLARQLADGARVVAGRPACLAAVSLMGLVGLLGSPFIALVPAVAVKLLGAGARGTSVLVAAQGAGAVAGVLALGPLVAKLGSPRLLAADLFALPALLCAYVLAPGLGWAAAGLFVVGLSYIWILSGLNTVAQLGAPEWARGRVAGIYMMVLGTAYPLGAVAQGALADRLGLRPVVVAAAAALAGSLALVAWRRPGLLAALDTSGGGGAPGPPASYREASSSKE